VASSDWLQENDVIGGAGHVRDDDVVVSLRWRHWWCWCKDVAFAMRCSVCIA